MHSTSPGTTTGRPQPPLARIGLIGDVHAECQALTKTLDFLASQRLDAILCTGDLADGSGDINRCCELLQTYNVHTVRGNHDRWLLSDTVRHVADAHRREDLTADSLQFLTHLPTQLRFDTDLGALLLCHGVLDDDKAKIWPGTERMPPERSDTLDALIANGSTRLLINGHMHYRTLIYFDGLTLLNAGTLKQRHRPGFSIVDFATAWVTAYEFTEAGPQAVRALSLQPGVTDTVWANSASFTGIWEPTVLYEQH